MLKREKAGETPKVSLRNNKYINDSNDNVFYASTVRDRDDYVFKNVRDLGNRPINLTAFTYEDSSFFNGNHQLRLGYI